MIISDELMPFTEGVRCLMLINRGVGNSHKGSKRWISKLISTNTQEFEMNLQALLDCQKFHNNPDIRLYSSINSRKFDSAIKMFQHRQIELTELNERRLFYKNIQAYFVSCLMKPENRESKYFLLDIDGDVQDFYAVHMLEDSGVKFIHDYPTPNGWHVITEPFNPVLANDLKNCTIQKDGLMIWNI